MDIFDKCLQQDYGNFNEIRKTIDIKKMQFSLIPKQGNQAEYLSQNVTVWSRNDYLGLYNHPSNRELDKAMVQEHSVVFPQGSRFITGNSDYHNRLEEKLSEFLEKEQTLLFMTGYLAAIGTIPALANNGDTVLLDSEAHACLFDAARIAYANGAKLKIFQHNNLEHLEKMLALTRKNEPNKGILIVCDGVYSMTGEFCPLDGIVALKEKYKARLLLDDAHGGGVMGTGGRGTPNHFKLADKVDLNMQTFSKAFGSVGGSMSGDGKVIEFLKLNARTNIFSHTLPLIYVKRVFNVFDLLENEPQILAKLQNNSRRFKEGLRKIGIISQSESPITPISIVVKDKKTLLNDAYQLFLKMINEHKIFASPVVAPAIPEGKAILRMIPNAMHTDQEIDEALVALKTVKEEDLIC